MTHPYDIQNRHELAIHKATFDFHYLGETPERQAALHQALDTNEIPAHRIRDIQCAARLGAYKLREID